jgi:phosphinothricin acetyltransferase
MLSLRSATDRDAAAIAAIYAPYVTELATSFETTPPAAAEMQARVHATQAVAPWLVAADGDAVLGYAYAARHRERLAYQWIVDASVYLDAGARRRGLVTALYTSLFALLRRQGFLAVHGGITLPNEASVALHERFGFRPASGAAGPADSPPGGRSGYAS